MSRAGWNRDWSRRPIPARSCRRCVWCAISTNCPSRLGRISGIRSWAGWGRPSSSTTYASTWSRAVDDRQGGPSSGRRHRPRDNAIGARSAPRRCPRSVRLRGARFRRRRDRRARDRAHRRNPRGLPRRRRRAACGRGRTQVGYHRPDRATTRTGPARGAPRTESVREPAPGPAGAGALRRKPAEARRDRADGPDGRSRADGRDLLRRKNAHRLPRVGRLRLHQGRDRTDRESGIPRCPLARHERR